MEEAFGLACNKDNRGEEEAFGGGEKFGNKVKTM